MFFGTVLRSVVDNLHAGIVVAAHPFYLTHPDYRQHATGLIERHIQIPEVETAAALASILAPRVRFASRTHCPADVFAPEGLDELFAVYRSEDERSIRSALAIAHAALGRCHAEDGEVISTEHVRAGADDVLLR